MKLLDHKKRPLIYAFTLCIGLLVLIFNLRQLENKYFYTTSIVLYFILIFELISTRFHASQMLKQLSLPQAMDNMTVHLIHHIFLPTLLYLGLITYIFFNHEKSIEILTLTISFLSFSGLFTNIKAHYEDKHNLEKQTKAIYDIITLISIFFLSDFAIKIFIYNNLNQSFIAILMCIIFIIFAILFLLRMQLVSKPYIVLTTVYMLIATIINIIFSMYITNINIMALLQPLFFYYYLAYVHHKQDNSLNIQIIIEYFVVFLLISVLIIGVI